MNKLQFEAFKTLFANAALTVFSFGLAAHLIHFLLFGAITIYESSKIIVGIELAILLGTAILGIERSIHFLKRGKKGRNKNVIKVDNSPV